MNNGNDPATKQDLAVLKQELVEAIHDTETRILKAFYGYTESVQKHFADLDGSQATLRERLGTLENRVTEVERRLNEPPSR